MKTLMIYGAAGYTGRMAAINARAAGVDVVVAGRAKDEAKLAALAAEIGAQYRLFAVDDVPATETALVDIGVLAAAEAARRVLGGEARPGFQTPTGLFGAGFAETIADTSIVDL